MECQKQAVFLGNGQMASMGLSRGEPHAFQKLNDSSDKIMNWLLFSGKMCKEYFFPWINNLENILKGYKKRINK